MRCPVYSSDLELITVIEISSWLRSHLDRYGCARLSAHEPAGVMANPGPPLWQPLRTVCITAHKLRNFGAETFLLIADDEESALLLKSILLPGQQRQVNEIAARAYARGTIQGISLARDLGL